MSSSTDNDSDTSFRTPVRRVKHRRKISQVQRTDSATFVTLLRQLEPTQKEQKKLGVQRIKKWLETQEPRKTLDNTEIKNSAKLCDEESKNVVKDYNLMTADTADTVIYISSDDEDDKEELLEVEIEFASPSHETVRNFDEAAQCPPTTYTELTPVPVWQNSLPFTPNTAQNYQSSYNHTTTAVSTASLNHNVNGGCAAMYSEHNYTVTGGPCVASSRFVPPTVSNSMFNPYNIHNSFDPFDCHHPNNPAVCNFQNVSPLNNYLPPPPNNVSHMPNGVHSGCEFYNSPTYPSMNNEIIPYNPHPNEFIQARQNFAGWNDIDQCYARSGYNGQAMPYPAYASGNTEGWGSDSQWDSRVLHDNAINPNTLSGVNPPWNMQNGFQNANNIGQATNTVCYQQGFGNVNNAANESHVSSLQPCKVSSGTYVNTQHVEMHAQGESKGVEQNSGHGVIVVKPIETLYKKHSNAPQASASEGKSNETRSKPNLKIDLPPRVNSESEVTADDNVFYSNTNIASAQACDAVDQIFFGKNFVKDLMEFSAPTPIARVHPVLSKKDNSSADQSQPSNQ